MLATYLTNTFFGLVVLHFTEAAETISTLSLHEGDSLNCSRVSKEPRVEVVHSGWPFSLKCDDGALRDHMHKVFYDNSYEDYEINYDTSIYESTESDMVCLIWNLDESRLVYNQSFLYGELIPTYHATVTKESNLINYEMELLKPSTGACISTLLRINIEKINQTCEEAKTTTKHFVRKLDLHDRILLTCLGPDYPKIPGNNFTHKWFFNCAKLPNNTMFAGTKDIELRIHNASYENPGIYTCAVVQNGKALYTAHHRICVKAPRLQTVHTIKCSRNKVYAKVGDEATLDCIGIVSAQFTKHFLPVVTWKKKLDEDTPVISRCTKVTNSQRRGRQSINHHHVSCVYEVEDAPCFDHIPSEAERVHAPYSIHIKMTLTIRNVEKSDFGEYFAILPSPEVNTTIVLVEDELASLYTTVIAMGVVNGILGLLLIVAALNCMCRSKFYHSTLNNKKDDDEATLALHKPFTIF